MSLSGHILPILAAALVWFAATGLIVWLDSRPRETFGTSLKAGGLFGAVGLIAIVAASGASGIAAVYISFAGALAIWGWHELAFLTGAVTGPRRRPCDPGARGLRRFLDASATVIHHELALAATAIILLSLSWTAETQTGALAFLLLFVFRLSAKLNIFAGVPNFSDELLPGHLFYLRSYFGSRRFTPLLLVSLAAALMLTVWLGGKAIAAPADSAQAAGASLLFALAALGTLEHLFLALPFRDGALWRWAVPARRNA
ncbi:MAG: putative photosynthetic complex assembly protein PuhE [Sphingomonadaceae bacterium]